MATTLILPAIRFTAQVNTGTPEAKANYKALAQRNAFALEECPWADAASDTAKPSLVEHDFTKTFTDEKYDAFLMTGAYDSTANTEIAYAGMVAYRFKLPQAYLTGGASLVNASVMLTRDRFLLPGLRISAVLSDSETPSTDWEVVRGDAEGCVKLSAQLANPAERITAAEQAMGAVAVNLTGLDATKKAYLWIYLTVEDYTATWTWYSSTQHRLYAIEGSGMIVSQSTSVTFSASVAPDTPSDAPISFPVVRHGVTQSNFGAVSGMCGIAVLANGDGFNDLTVSDVDGYRKYSLTQAQLDRYSRASVDSSDNYYIGLRSLYARFYAGNMEMAEYPSDANLRPGAGFSVRPESFAITDTIQGSVTLRGWSLSASSIAIPFSMPADFSVRRIAMSWGTGGNTTGGTVNGGTYNFWLKRGECVNTLPETLLKNPDIYIGDKEVVDGWELLGRGNGGSVDFTLATPLEDRVATVLVTAFVDQSASFSAGASGLRFLPRGASTEFEITPAAARELTADAVGLASRVEWLMKPDITLHGRSDVYASDTWTESDIAFPNPLCFTAEEANSTVALTAGSDAPAVSLRYSTNGTDWSDYAVGTTLTLADVGDKVYFAAGQSGNLSMASNSNTQNGPDENEANRFAMTGKIAASGDVTSLLDGNGPVLDLNGRTACFAWLFSDCVSLTSAPAFSSTKLENDCYYSTFRGCTSLEVAPNLPATNLEYRCYLFMFRGCTSLEVAPNLPATTLAEMCYEGMFYGCTSLEVAPNLPVTTLVLACYEGMFYGCTSLEVAPNLPATTLYPYCYGLMFWGCTSLASAPTLPATTMATGCYGLMFRGCTSLASAPTLPATRMANGCYEGMFSGCTSLTTAPKLPATTLATDCYKELFKDCEALTSITTNQTTFDNCTDWVKGVNGVVASGTFTCPSALGTNSTITRGDSACPTAWTVVNT